MQLLELAYDGTAYAGCPPTARHPTIGSVLTEALAGMGVSAKPDFLSRTDAGVHARGQLVLIDGPWRLSPTRALELLDRHLPADVRCTGIAAVDGPPTVAGKHYRYRLDVSPRGNPWARQAWRPSMRFDAERLHEVAAAIPGERDWCAFVRRGEQRIDTTRRIDTVQWTEEDRLLCCDVHGEAFTYRLVRSLVGAMLSVASGTCTLEQFHAALDGRTTPAATQQAPACGLSLERIHLTSALLWVR